MHVALRVTLAIAASALLSACAGPVHRVALDPARLVTQSQAKLQCPYRLGEVVDARPSTGRAGGLGNYMFLLQDAAGLVRSKLETISISAAASTGDTVGVQLEHLYMTRNTVTKVSVLVLRVTVAGEPPFLLRSQLGSMSWNGTENEAYAAYSRLFDDAMGQMVGRLNARCVAARG